jgi:phosphatidate cytidylyltransferase
VTRVLSGAILGLVAVAIVWWAPPALFLAVGELLLLLAFLEYLTLARTTGLAVPAIPSAVAAMLTCAALVPWLNVPLDVVLISAFVALSALTLTVWADSQAAEGASNALGLAAASIFPSLYLGLPLGAMIAVREGRGRDTLLLLMLTVVVSDTAQYYSGRAFGRRPLAPAISPKKTIAGAVGGLLFGAVTFVVAGSWGLPSVPPGLRAAIGVMVVALGIAGDLFESMLKRSAGMKDSSGLIPGHGGILDRIDALLFVAPVYYVVLKYV